MTPSKPRPHRHFSSHDNHTLLIELRDGLQSLSATVVERFEQQAKLNDAIVKKLDDHSQQLGARGKVQPQHISVLLALLSLLIVVGTTYIATQVSPLKEDSIAMLKEIERMTGVMTESRIITGTKTAEIAADVRWVVKLQDDTRARIHDLEKQQHRHE